MTPQLLQLFRSNGQRLKRVARASSPAGFGTVSVREPFPVRIAVDSSETGGETPPEPAGEDARATSKVPAAFRNPWVFFTKRSL